MNEFGWFFIQNYFAYSLVVFKYYYFKYEEYNRRNNTLTMPHIRGVGMMPPVIFILFLNSLYIFFCFNQVYIDFNLDEPYKVKYFFDYWDPIEDFDFFVTEEWPEFLGRYIILDAVDYEKVDWGLPFGIKMHKFLIFAWWLSLLRDLFLHFKKCYFNFFDYNDAFNDEIPEREEWEEEEEFEDDLEWEWEEDFDIEFWDELHRFVWRY